MQPVEKSEMGFDVFPKQEAVCGCCRKLVPTTTAVEIVYTPDTQRARFGNLMVCKSVWMCQFCARRISERRREALRLATAQWRREGGTVLLASFTVQHHASDKVTDLKNILRKARRLMLGGKARETLFLKWGIRFTVIALENTHGENGHHPHLHVLFFLMPGAATLYPDGFTQAHFEAFMHELRLMWQKRVKAAGGSADYEHGCLVSNQQHYIDEYVAKFGIEPVKWGIEDELTRQNTKLAKNDSHRSMKQLLFDYLMGDDAAGLVWKEFALAFKGERQLVSSQGFGDYFGVKDLLSAKFDGEAPETEQDVTLARIDPAAWKLLLRYGATRGREIRAELLNVAATGDGDKLGAYLEKIAVEIAERLKPDLVEDEPPAAPGHTLRTGSVSLHRHTSIEDEQPGRFSEKPVTQLRYEMPPRPPGDPPPKFRNENNPDINTE